MYESQISLDGRSKGFTTFIIIGIIVLLIITLGIVRAQVKDARIQQLSITLRGEMLKSVVQTVEFTSKNFNEGNGPYLKENYSQITLSEARAALEESKRISQRYFDESRENYGANQSEVIRSLSSHANIVVLSEGILDLLEENRYDLEKKLEEIRESLATESDASQNGEVSQKTRDKIKEINKNIAPTTALILDTLIFSTHHAEIVAGWNSWVRANQRLFDDSPKETYTAFEDAIEENLFPSEGDIAALDLKSGCLKSLKEEYGDDLSKSSETADSVLFISGTLEDICTHIDKYERVRALKLLNRAKNEKNMLVRLQDREHLEVLLRCHDVWLSTEAEQCILSYFEEFRVGIPSEISVKEYEAGIGARSS